MSSINSVRKLQILYFSRKKNKEIKNLKKVSRNAHLYILLKTLWETWFVTKHLETMVLLVNFTELFGLSSKPYC